MARPEHPHYKNLTQLKPDRPVPSEPGLFGYGDQIQFPAFLFKEVNDEQHGRTQIIFTK